MYTTPNKTSLKFGIYYLLKLLLWLLKIPTVISFLVLVLVRGGVRAAKNTKLHPFRPLETFQKCRNMIEHNKN